MANCSTSPASEIVLSGMCGSTRHRVHRAGRLGTAGGILPAICILQLILTGMAKAQSTSALRGRVQVTEADGGNSADLSRGVVYVESEPGLNSEAPPARRPQIVQKDKKFIPDLLVVSRGTTVEFPNHDPFSHNVFSRSQVAPFDLDRYPQGVSKSYKFQNVGLVQIFCNVHPNMRAVILVVPNKYFAQADAQGRFEIAGLPAGRYTLVAWHERTGAQRQQILMRPGAQSGEISFALVEQQVRIRAPVVRRHREPQGVTRGLGLKRERLNLPVIEESHPAPDF